MPATPYAPAAKQGSFIPEFLRSIRANLGYYANTMKGGGYLRHRIVVMAGNERATALIFRGKKVIGYETDLLNVSEPPRPSGSQVGDLSLDPDNTINGRLLKPYGIGKPTRLLILSDFSDQFLFMFSKMERAKAPDALLKGIRLNPVEEFGQQWRHAGKPFTWHAFAPDLGESDPKPSSEHVVAGVATEEVTFFEGWADTHHQELQAVVPGYYGTFKFFVESIWENHKPAFGVIVRGKTSLLAFWNGRHVTHMLNEIETESISEHVVEILKETGLTRQAAEITGGEDEAQPAGETSVFVFARTDRELDPEQIDPMSYTVSLEGVNTFLLTSDNLRELLGPIGSERVEEGFTHRAEPECWLMQWAGASL